MDNINEVSQNLNKATDKANILATEMLVQFDTMAQLQMQERQTILDRHMEEKESMRKHYSHIIWGLIAALVILIGGIVGGAFYILANYEFGVITTQNPIAEGEGRAIIEDGIHLDPNGILEGVISGD